MKTNTIKLEIYYHFSAKKKYEMRFIFIALVKPDFILEGVFTFSKFIRDNHFFLNLKKKKIVEGIKHEPHGPWCLWSGLQVLPVLDFSLSSKQT